VISTEAAEGRRYNGYAVATIAVTIPSFRRKPELRFRIVLGSDTNVGEHMASGQCTRP
jgi:hypothetical protein